jgi:hypothetical protein
MRHNFAITAATLLVTCGAAQGTAPKPATHLLNTQQVQQIVRLVARHDDIDLSDTHVEVNSLDLMSPFIPGYASFILIREATTPGPDETLHRYAVNRRTGDVWEMTQCTRYDFPALARLQQAIRGHVATAGEIAAERQELGCSKTGGSSANPL